ncbi:MAG: transglutaminase-like domain-containing protein [Bacteroides sp.]|nr:transglutaminase-like domain-containing protein [Bacteroides sp.]
MRNHLLITLFLGIALCTQISSCSSKIEKNENRTSETETPQLLDKDGAQAWYTLMKKVKPEIANPLVDVEITPQEYDELKAFADKLAQGLSGQKEVFKHFVAWTKNHIKHENSDNRPYAVWKSRKGVCQGFSGLLKILCHTQNIPALVVNGEMYSKNKFVGGHAWSCAFVDGVWMVADPTNTTTVFEMKPNGQYEDRLVPQFMMSPVFEDESFVYAYQNSTLCVRQIKNPTATMTIPESAMGLYIGSLAFETPVSETITQLHLSKYIQTLGDNASGVNDRIQNLEKITIDPENKELEAIDNVVYLKNSSQPYFVPNKLKLIKLKAVETTDKNWLSNLPHVEEVYFHPQTKNIEAYTIENCRSLKKIHIPSTAKIADNAFVNNGTSTQIIKF